MEDQWEELPNLKSGVLYETKVITMDNDANYYDGDDLPTIQFETECLDPDNLPDRVDAQLGLEQLKEIYDEALANLKPFSTAPESVESFREEEMFPLSDRLYAEYYAITKYLRRAVSAVDSKPSTTSEPGIRHPTSFDLSIANIPKLEVTPFDGDFRSFDAFYASFTSIIHENTILSNTQKLQYLINALDKQTKNIIAHLPLQDASYQRALDLLKARFSNPLRAVTAHTDSILKLPNLDNPTAKSLRHFIDTHNLNFNALCNLTPNNVSETVYSALILSKLSPQLKSQLHKSRDSTSLPSVTEIFHFLTEEAVHKETVALYSTATSSGTSNQSRASPTRNPVLSFITSAPSSRCIACQLEGHRIYSCPTFQKLTTKERWDKVKDLKLCSNCLSTHLKSRCKSKHTCSSCHKPHHSLLHRPSPIASHSAFPGTTASNLTSHGPPETLKSSAASLKVPSGPAVLSTSLQPSSVLLATALVKIYTSETNFLIVRAVLDSASQASFVSEAAVNSLKIKRDHSAIPISGIGLSDSQSSGLSHISVASLSGAVVSTNHPFLVLPVITRVASSLPPSPEFTAALKNVVLADPSFNSAAHIDCLLGASIFPTILTGAPRSLGPSLPYAVPTLFGDVLMGRAPLTPLSCNVACVSLLTSAEHNPALRNAPAYPVESHDPGPATLLSRSGDRDSVDHSPDSQDPPIKMLHRSLEVEKTPPTKVLQLPLGSASEEFSLKPNEQTSKPADELLETAPESPGIPLITTPESYSLNSISSWPRRFRVVATILARRSRNHSKPHSTRPCVWHAEIAVCQHIQQSRFAPQLNQTQAGKPLSKSWVERAERERCVADLYEVGMWTESGWTTQLFNSPVWNLKELLPSTEYKLRVKAVKRSNPQPYYYITVNTLPDKDESVTDLKVVRNDFKSVQLSWESTSSSFSVLYMCEEIILTGEDCSWDSRKFDEIKTNEVTLSSLHPFRRYKVQVCSAFDCSYIFVITSESLAQVAPELVSFTSTDSSALITWKSPSNCSLCNGIIIGYDVTLEDEHGKVEFKKRITDRTWIKAENLVPSSLYKLYIAIVTQMGSSRIPLEVDTFTKATVPFGVKDLSVYKTGRREIGLKWREPNHLFGNLSSFSVALAGDPNKTYLHSPLRCPAWPSQYYCYTIKDLKPDTSYNISVSARNDIIEEDGAKTYVTATTSESAPGEPLDLWVSDESETGFTVSWSPPERFNGVLRSFLVKVEQTESYDPALCCQYYPKKEIIVQQEQPAFETQISGLSPGSTYAVSVMGETVWLGPAAKTTGNTRPPPPSPAEIDPPVTMHIQGADAIQVQWPTQPPQHSNTSIHSPVVGRVVLLLSEAENASIPQTEWKDPEVKAAVEDSIGGLDKYIVIKQFKEAGGIEVGNRGNVSTEEYNPANGYWTTSLEPVDVPAGNYSMAIVALARYCHLYSATSLTSLPFAILLN
ncbi:hypothetical protein AAG570_009578 [Ranatra chinensis]|uniref:Fibronectin type-III domain-containing protein n=1 Tax=Ranatra chinensis TaxID=642074 RepID=A0ABD0YPL3_9HEMI